MIFKIHYISPLGPVMLTGDGNHITGLWNEGQKYYGSGLPGDTAERDDLPVFAAAKNWLDRYFDGQRPSISDLPLTPAGSDFRRAVWDLLCEIPYGSYITYGDIAKALAARMGKASISVQAVGGAVGHNPISIIIPCHRVVGADGSLTGYAGGIEKKIKLLEHEGADMSRLFIPTRGTAL